MSLRKIMFYRRLQLSRSSRISEIWFKKFEISTNFILTLYYSFTKFCNSFLKARKAFWKSVLSESIIQIWIKIYKFKEMSVVFSDLFRPFRLRPRRVVLVWCCPRINIFIYEQYTSSLYLSYTTNRICKSFNDFPDLIKFIIYMAQSILNLLALTIMLSDFINFH